MEQIGASFCRSWADANRKNKIMRGYYTKAIEEGMPPIINDLPSEYQEIAAQVLDLARSVGNVSSDGSDSNPSGDEVEDSQRTFDIRQISETRDEPDVATCSEEEEKAGGLSRKAPAATRRHSRHFIPGLEEGIAAVAEE